MVRYRARKTVWETVEVTVDAKRHRGRYRAEGRYVVLEWRGGRVRFYAGWARMEVAVAARLRTLVTREMVAA
jgi:hypothetical protein